MHIVIVGPTCAGKTWLAEALERLGFRRIITYTTRPKRNYEVDATQMTPIELRYSERPADYYFVTDEQFKKAKKRNYFAETTSYEATWGHCEYGSAKEDWLGYDDTVCVLNPDGVRQLRAQNYDIFVVYLDTPMAECMDRARKRGDDDKEVARRCAHDLEDFKKFEDEIVSRSANINEQGEIIRDSYKETHLYDLKISDTNKSAYDIAAMILDTARSEE